MDDITALLSYVYVIGSLLIVIGLAYMGLAIFQYSRGKRKWEYSSSKLPDFILGLVALAPIVGSFYVLPMAFYNEGFWSSTNADFIQGQNAIIGLSILIFGFYIFVSSTMFLPHENKYYNLVPSLLLPSLIPGLANTLIVMIITSFVNDGVDPKYLFFFFCICTYTYIITIRYSKRKAARVGVLVAQDLNVMILEKIFSFSYMKYEKIKSSKIYTILNNDINAIVNFSRLSVHMYTAIVMALTVIVYLFTLNLISSLLLLVVVLLIIGFSVLLAGPHKKAIMKARNERENYTNLITGLAYGFKELVLHWSVRKEYRNDIVEGSGNYYVAYLKSLYHEINRVLFSDLSFIIAIGTTCLLFPLIFNFDKGLITAYVIATLFLWAPFNTIIDSVPIFLQVQVAWGRIQKFLKSGIADDQLLLEHKNVFSAGIDVRQVDSLKIQNLSFTYPKLDKEEETYGIGPINFEAYKGDIVYIIGGNGSGKTTLLKILIGLYEPEEGQILINEKKVDAKNLGEYFSVIYSDFYLFKKIYGIKNERLEQVYIWLEDLGLSEKVNIKDGQFSTLDLSKGQRKRLAIIKSYLEDRPIYFFDECAADLDPDFKKFFYNELLPRMRDEGKILLIITHDENYFYLADRTYKMVMGKMIELEVAPLMS